MRAPRRRADDMNLFPHDDPTGAARRRDVLSDMLAHAAEVRVRGSIRGVMLAATPTATMLLGWHPDDLIGQPFLRFVHPADVAVAQAAHASLVAGRAQRFEVRLRSADDSYRPFEVSMRPDLDGAGHVIGCVGTWRSTDARPWSGPSDDDAVLRFVIDHSREVLLLVAPDRRVVWSATAVRDLLGWGTTTVVDRQIHELVHADDRSAVLPYLETTFRPQDPVAPPHDIVARLVSPAGEPTWASIRLVPLADADGALVGVVVSVREVGELFASREQLAAERSLLRAAIDSMLDPHVVLVPSRDRRGDISDFVLAHANPAACASQRTDLGSLLGRRLSEVAPTMWPNGLFGVIVEAAETNTPVAHEDFVYAHDEPDERARRYAVRAVPGAGRVCVSWRHLPAT